MIERVQLFGFKAVGVEGLDLPFAPITVLLGENSIGKSSVFQALLALQQSWIKLTGLSTFSPVGPSIDLGRFSSLQHRFGDYVAERIGLEIRFKGDSFFFSWTAPDQESIEEHEVEVVCPPPLWPQAWCKYGPADFGHLTHLEINDLTFFVYSEQQSSQVKFVLDISRLASIERIQDQKVSNAVNAGVLFTWVLDEALNDVSKVSFELDENCPKKERETAYSTIRDFQEADVEETLRGTLVESADRALRSLGPLRRCLRTISHIGGIRERGKRLYEINLADQPWAVGPGGERIADLLESYPNALDRTNKLLEKSKLGYNVSLSDPNTQAQVREILLEDTRDGFCLGNKVSLPDVGTGISQLLPIAVQIAVFMERGRFDTTPLVMIEQPELHLHPRLQARFSEMLAAAVEPELLDDGEGGATNKAVHFLIETHSEHLIRALGLLVEKKKLQPRDISLLKMWRDEDNIVRVESIRFDSHGRFLDSWPKGFFPELDQLLDGEIP